jgi:hypothetical protein
MAVASEASEIQHTMLPSEAMEVPATTTQLPHSSPHNCSPDQRPYSITDGETCDDTISREGTDPIEVTRPVTVHFTTDYADAFANAIIDAPTSSESRSHHEPLTPPPEPQVGSEPHALSQEQASPSAPLDLDPENEGPSFGEAQTRGLDSNSPVGDRQPHKALPSVHRVQTHHPEE